MILYIQKIVTPGAQICVCFALWPTTFIFGIQGWQKLEMHRMFNNNIWPNSAPLRDISIQSLSDLDIDLSRSLGSNVIASMASSYNISLVAPLRDIRLRNLSDLHFDFSRSLKVIYHSVIGLPIYAFLLIFNNNIWPKLSSFSRYRLSKSEWPWHYPLKVTDVKCNHINGLSIYAFLLMLNSNIWPLPLCEIEGFEIWVTLSLSFQGHSRSNVMVSLLTPHICFPTDYIYSNYMSISEPPSSYSHTKIFSPISYH